MERQQPRQDQEPRNIASHESSQERQQRERREAVQIVFDARKATGIWKGRK